jgi:hypothetical protein
MQFPELTEPPISIEQARRIWADYQHTHDIAAHDGESVAVDLVTGEVHFGPSAYQIGKRVQHKGQVSRWFVVRMNPADHRYLNRYRYGRPRRARVIEPGTHPCG